MNQPKRILICPLDWGLGHATRCIPIIRLLLQKNAEVIIAADGRPLALLKQEFPQLKYIEFKGYEISYAASDAMIFKMLLSVPKILKGIKKENRILDKIIDEHKIDIVISDNRYGCCNKKVKSIFITHQLMIKSPVGEKALHKKVLKYINNYTECWIPDVDGENNLSGDLAHKYELPKNVYFVGALSRFTNLNRDSSHPPDSYRDGIKNEYDIMAIISGPEPQRSIFEKIIIKQISSTKQKAFIVLGLPENENTIYGIKDIEVVSHLNSEEMKQAILNSKLIIARSGYSTIMDLVALNKKAFFIPTPGQTEQEYLSELFMKRRIAFSQKQSQFKLLEAIKESESYSGFKFFENNNSLEERINLMLSSK